MYIQTDRKSCSILWVICMKYQCPAGMHHNLPMDSDSMPSQNIVPMAKRLYLFRIEVEVKRFLERQPTFPKDLNGREIRNQRVYDFLTRALYCNLDAGW